ncbi:hypothetical protein [Herbiconiux sp. A18JL235]|uniref:Uncharacterized protein n=1 Tax=Herbiconiux sp. A18JL235 TaxID=3152363 RepID=A0AB39BL06_9MICO
MSTDGHTAPIRSQALLAEWVEEFRAQGDGVAGTLDVLLQDGSDGRDTGLVIVRLKNAPADVFMQPRDYDDPFWEATLTARGDLSLTPYQLASLAAEIVVAGNLCTFLQFKSLEWDRESGLRGHGAP